MFFRFAGLRSVFLLLVTSCVVLPVSLAQFSSSVQGTVTDSSGAVVSGATVTLHNAATGVENKQQSNDSGFYRFNAVPPGNYLVDIKAQGFQSSSISVSVTTAEIRGVDVTLQVAKSNVSVTVQSVASSLNPEETRVQSTLTASEISKLPLPNRDVQQLVALTPGVVGFQNESASNGYGSSIFAGNFTPPYSANGMASNSNIFLVDDLPVSDAQIQGGALILPNADMIDQVSLQTQTYSVENSTAASIQTAYTTKSGSNGLHGAVDYTYDSSNVGAAKQPIVNKLTPFHQNLLLASLGGSLIKNRTFFFGSVERQNAAIGNASATNPYFTPQFVNWALNTFPNSATAKGLLFAPPTRDEGGIPLTAGALYPADSKFPCGQPQSVSGLAYTLPCDLPVYVQGATFNQAQPFNGTQWNLRLDHNLRSDKDRIYVMYERIDQKTGNLAERPKLDAVTPSQNKYFSVNYVHIFGAHLLNEAHFGNLRVINGSQLGDPRAASIPYLPILLDTGAGIFTFPFGATPFGAQTNKQHTYAFRDTVSYTVGNHNIRVGYQFFRGDVFQDSSQIYSRPFVPFYGMDTVSYISNAVPTGYSLYTIGASGKYTPQYYGASSTYHGVFVEDTWKVRPDLTITAGIRYDAFGNPTPYGSTAQPFVPLFPGAGTTFQQQAINTTTHITHQAFTESQNLNILPRVGFAYTPRKSKLTLIRGGAGLYENVLTPFQIAGNLPTQPPNRISLYTTSIVPYGDFQSMTAPYGYNYSYPTYGVDPSGNIYSNPEQTEVFSANLNGFAPKVKPEKIINFSLGVEQQFKSNLVLGITYAGSYGYDLIYGAAAANGGGNADYNLAVNSPTARPTSEWGSINYGRNGLSSNYNALIVVVRQNYKSLSYQANYNWSHALQYAPTVSVPSQSATYYVWKGIYDPKSYYGPASFDVPNSFSFAGTFEVPKLFKSSFANQVVSGWRLSTMAIAQSGTPFTVVEPGTDYQNDGSTAFDGNGGGTPGFPNYSGIKRSGFSRSRAVSGVLDASLFSDPAGVGTGPVTSNQGANSFRNLGYFTVNGGLSKSFGLPLPGTVEGTHAQLTFRGEAVNLLNRTNYQGFDSDLTDTSFFGKVRTANQKRYMQLCVRLEF